MRYVRAQVKIRTQRSSAVSRTEAEGACNGEYYIVDEDVDDGPAYRSNGSSVWSVARNDCDGFERSPGAVYQTGNG